MTYLLFRDHCHIFNLTDCTVCTPAQTDCFLIDVRSGRHACHVFYNCGPATPRPTTNPTPTPHTAGRVTIAASISGSLIFVTAVTFTIYWVRKKICVRSSGAVDEDNLIENQCEDAGRPTDFENVDINGRQLFTV